MHEKHSSINNFDLGFLLLSPLSSYLSSFSPCSCHLQPAAVGQEQKEEEKRRKNRKGE